MIPTRNSIAAHHAPRADALVPELGGAARA